MSRIRCVLFTLVLLLVSFTAMAVPVDINSADAQTLAEALNGVGMAKAEAIVVYREQYGPFRQIEDLLQVKGVGPRILEKNRDAIMVETKKPQ